MKCLLVVVILVVFVFVLFCFFVVVLFLNPTKTETKSNTAGDNPRLFCIDGEEEHTRLNRLGDLDKLFPPSWKEPSSLLEALQQADIPNAEDVSVACEEIGEAVCSRATMGSGVSKEDAAVIACYTFDFGSASYEFVSHQNLHFFLFLSIFSYFFRFLPISSFLLLMLMCLLT